MGALWSANIPPPQLVPVSYLQMDPFSAFFCSYGSLQSVFYLPPILRGDAFELIVKSKDRCTPFWVPFAERYFTSDQPVSNPVRGPFFIVVSLPHDCLGGHWTSRIFCPNILDSTSIPASAWMPVPQASIEARSAEDRCIGVRIRPRLLAGRRDRGFLLGDPQGVEVVGTGLCTSVTASRMTDAYGASTLRVPYG